MQRRIALKRLTPSDLTLFEWQFRNRYAGNQKSINLNADVFIEQLFPALPEAAVDTGGRFPLDLSIYGPGHSGLHNLQRKILKGGTYKNWRLDGEYITNPENEQGRYNALQAGDFAIFEFQGRLVPAAAKLILVAQALPVDRPLHALLDTFLGARKMMAVAVADLQTIGNQFNDDAHPFRELTIDAALEDAALGGVKGIRTLHQRPAARALSREELQRARRVGEEVGRAGEELVCQYLITLKARGAIEDFTWTAGQNAVAPYDFLIVLTGGTEIAVDVKSTSGEFERSIHISYAELTEMTGARRYDIYRVYGVGEASGAMRISENTGPFAATVLRGMNMPVSVTVDSVSVDVAAIPFGGQIRLEPPVIEE
jgi:Domain of unknown function (DUF3883)